MLNQEPDGLHRRRRRGPGVVADVRPRRRRRRARDASSLSRGIDADSSSLSRFGRERLELLEGRPRRLLLADGSVARLDETGAGAGRGSGRAAPRRCRRRRPRAGAATTRRRPGARRAAAAATPRAACRATTREAAAAARPRRAPAARAAPRRRTTARRRPGRPSSASCGGRLAASGRGAPARHLGRPRRAPGGAPRLVRRPPQRCDVHGCLLARVLQAASYTRDSKSAGCCDRPEWRCAADPYADAARPDKGLGAKEQNRKENGFLRSHRFGSPRAPLSEQNSVGCPPKSQIRVPIDARVWASEGSSRTGPSLGRAGHFRFKFHAGEESCAGAQSELCCSLRWRRTAHRQARSERNLPPPRAPPPRGSSLAGAAPATNAEGPALPIKYADAPPPRPPGMVHRGRLPHGGLRFGRARERPLREPHARRPTRTGQTLQNPHESVDDVACLDIYEDEIPVSMKIDASACSAWSLESRI